MRDVSEYFYKGGLNCAESVMKSLIEDGAIDLPIETVRMMTGFGGGLHRGSICGAVTGSVAALGAKYGRTSTDESRKTCTEAVSCFLKQFEEEYGTIYCRDLREKYAKGHKTKSEGMYRACTVFVQRAAEIAEGLLKETSSS